MRTKNDSVFFLARPMVMITILINGIAGCGQGTHSATPAAATLPANTAGITGLGSPTTLTPGSPTNTNPGATSTYYGVLSIPYAGSAGGVVTLSTGQNSYLINPQSSAQALQQLQYMEASLPYGGYVYVQFAGGLSEITGVMPNPTAIYPAIQLLAIAPY